MPCLPAVLRATLTQPHARYALLAAHTISEWMKFAALASQTVASRSLRTRHSFRFKNFERVHSAAWTERRTELRTERNAANGKRKRKRKASGCRERVTIFFSLYNTLQVSLWNNNFNSIKLNNNSITTTTTTTTTKTNRDNSEKNSVRLIVRKQNKLRSVANRIESNRIKSDQIECEFSLSLSNATASERVYFGVTRKYKLLANGRNHVPKNVNCAKKIDVYLKVQQQHNNYNYSNNNNRNN